MDLMSLGTVCRGRESCAVFANNFQCVALVLCSRTDSTWVHSNHTVTVPGFPCAVNPSMPTLLTRSETRNTPTCQHITSQHSLLTLHSPHRGKTQHHQRPRQQTTFFATSVLLPSRPHVCSVDQVVCKPHQITAARQLRWSALAGSSASATHTVLLAHTTLCQAKCLLVQTHPASCSGSNAQLAAPPIGCGPARTCPCATAAADRCV